MAEKKEKRYVSDNAKLLAEWNWEKNNELGFDPGTLTLGSNKKVWWKCSKGHEWQALINNRNKGSGCPCCAGQKVIKGYNDLQTTNPTLANEWNYEKNNGLTPMDVMPNNPTLAKEWNHEKNKVLTPIDVTTNSGKKVWWKCGKGHEWQATIYSRNTGRGCPYCSGRYVIKGKNDLEKINPILATEWHPTKNLGLLPCDVAAGSEKKVWWKCEKGHEWQATIASRNSGNGCPVCNSERQTSFPEYAIVYYLKKYGLDVLHSYRGQGYELDVYIPSKKIAIEYDGSFWHKNKTRKDLEKNQRCKKDGIKLYRIREDLPSLNDSSIDFVVQKGQKDLQKILKNLLSEIIGLNIDVNLERDTIAIENLREYTEKHNSILISNPEIAREWNYEKNGNLKPEHFAANSNKKVWWKCEKGHEWEASIYSRNKGHGCPYCSNIKILKGYNDLQTINPVLAKEWNYEKNKELTPSDVMSNSGKKVWWKCSMQR